MSSRIQGITVEIGGDTTKLSTALKGVNGEIKKTQAQLMDVERLLKMDPGNTELLAQKQRLLAQSVGETKTKLEALTQAADQAKTALDSGKISQEQYDGLQREIVETQNKLKDLESQATKASVSLQKITQAGDKLKTIGGAVSDVGMSMTKNVTAPIVAMGAVAVTSFNEVDGGYDQIITKTGATGEALEGLTKSADKVFGSMPVEMSDVGIAIGEVNTRFGVTGKTLEDLSADFLKFAQINETDLNTAIGSTDKMMNQFGIDVSQTQSVLGILTAKAQETGISVDSLMNSVQTNGATLKSMGLNMGQSITLLSQFEQKGVNAEAAMAGLKKGVINYTKQGMSMDKALTATIESIKKASTETEALTIATEIFGAKGANEMTKAIREGRFSMDELSGSMSSYQTTVGDTFSSTLDGVDNFKTSMNNAKLAAAQLGEAISNVLGPILQAVSEKLRAFTAWFSGLSDGTKEFIVKLALVLAVVGPILVIVGKVISAIGIILTVVPKIVSAIQAVKTVFAALNLTMLANPIVLIVAAIAALIAAFLYLWKNCDGFRQFWIDLWENVKQIAVAVWNGIKAFFQQIWEAIKLIFTTVFEVIKTLFLTFFNLYKTIIVTVFQTIRTVITTIWEAIKGVFVTIFESIKAVFIMFFTIYKTIIQTVFTIIQTVVLTVWNTIKTIILTVLKAIQTIFTTVWNAIRTIVQAVVNGIKGLITGNFTAVKDSIMTIMNTIKETIATIWNTIKNTVTSVLGAIQGAIYNVFHGIVEAIKGAMSNILNAVKTGFTSVKNFITGLEAQAVNWGKDLVMGMVKGITSCIGAIADAVKSIADKIKSFLHFSVPDEGPLTDYESWMPDFMSGLAKGIQKSKGLVAAAMDGVAETMVVRSDINATASVSHNPVSQAESQTNLVDVIKGALAEIYPQSGDTVIPIYIGNRMIDELIIDSKKRVSIRSGGLANV